MTRLELKTTFALGSIFAFRMLGLFMILPIFSVYAEQLPNTTSTQIGLALGIYGLTQAIFQLPFGIWSDFTSRKKVIFIGLLIFALGSILAALSSSINGIIVGRALQGAGAIGSPTIALVGDLTSEKNRTKAMAIVGIMIALSFVTSIILGPLLGHWIRVSGIFWLTAFFALLGIIILWQAIPTPAHQHREFDLKALPQQLKYVLCNPYLLRLNSSILFTHAILTSFFIALPIVLVKQYQFSFDQQWKIYLPTFFVVILCIGGILQIPKSLKTEQKQWVACISAIFISQIVLTHFLPLWILVMNLFLFFLGFTFLEALLPAMVSKTVSSIYRGTATGLFSSCQFLGIFLGGIFGGYFMQHYQAFGVFWGNTLLAFLWLLVMLPLLFGQMRK